MSILRRASFTSFAVIVVIVLVMSLTLSPLISTSKSSPFQLNSIMPSGLSSFSLSPSCKCIHGATSSNWAGYAITSRALGAVKNVIGSWKVPSVDCSKTPSSVSSAWIGINGWSDSTVEQIGTASFCNSNTAGYEAWWEMYPGPSEYISSDVHPGDVIQARVLNDSSACDREICLSLNDTTQGWTFETTAWIPYGKIDASSAEWITEAYSHGNSEQPLADFNFTYYGPIYNGLASKDIAAIGSHTGAIGTFKNYPSLYTVYRIDMYNCVVNCNYTAIPSGLFSGGSFYTRWVSE